MVTGTHYILLAASSKTRSLTLNPAFRSLIHPSSFPLISSVCALFIRPSSQSLICSGHGECDNGEGTCICDKGWQATEAGDCSENECPKAKSPSGSGMFSAGGFMVPHGQQCAGHGRCPYNTSAAGPLLYKCKCDGGWGGQTCLKRTCFPKCQHGACVNGQCACDPGWGGVGCEIKPCPKDDKKRICGGGARGSCDPDTGNCKCKEFHLGMACQFYSKPCANDCSGHGHCNYDNGQCSCNKGWYVPENEPNLPCSEVRCATSKLGVCSGKTRGTCNAAGDCECKKGFEGQACEYKRCPRGTRLSNEECAGKGKCDGNGTCICKYGYRGDACEEEYCGTMGEHDCSKHGACMDEKCVCRDGWATPTTFCSQQTCPTSQVNPAEQCSGHGACGKGGQCKCELGWSGRGCGFEYCPAKCNNRGTCNKAKLKCDCMEGFRGPACGVQYCTPLDCGGHGTCNHESKSCECALGFRGKSCNVAYCPKSGCGAHGSCSAQFEACKCDPGYMGETCEQCPGCEEATAAVKQKAVIAAEAEEAKRVAQALAVKAEAAVAKKAAEAAMEAQIREKIQALEARQAAAKALEVKELAAKKAAIKEAEVAEAAKRAAKAAEVKAAAKQAIAIAQAKIAMEKALAIAAVARAERVVRAAKKEEGVKEQIKAEREAEVIRKKEEKIRLAVIAKAAAKKAAEVAKALEIKKAHAKAIMKLMREAKIADEVRIEALRKTESAETPEAAVAAAEAVVKAAEAAVAAAEAVVKAREAAVARAEAVVKAQEAAVARAEAALAAAIASGDPVAIAAAKAAVAKAKAALAVAKIALAAAEKVLEVAVAAVEVAKAELTKAKVRLAEAQPVEAEVQPLVFKLPERLPNVTLIQNVTVNITRVVKGKVVYTPEVIVKQVELVPGTPEYIKEMALRRRLGTLQLLEGQGGVQFLSAFGIPAAPFVIPGLAFKVQTGSKRVVAGMDLKGRVPLMTRLKLGEQSFRILAIEPMNATCAPTVDQSVLSAARGKMRAAVRAYAVEQAAAEKCQAALVAARNTCAMAVEEMNGVHANKDASQLEVSTVEAKQAQACVIDLGGQVKSCNAAQVTYTNARFELAAASAEVEVAGKPAMNKEDCELKEASVVTLDKPWAGAAPKEGVDGTLTPRVGCGHPACHGHGACSMEDKCVCKPGYTGESDCKDRSCANDCNGQGACNDGTCFCLLGFAGKDCRTRICPDMCNDHGKCINGTKCDCEEGYWGLSCAEGTGKLKCPNDCSENGKCQADGNCKCTVGFYGADCAMQRCPGWRQDNTTSVDCGGHGSCKASTGSCDCYEGWIGSGCESKVCPDNCNGNGDCVDGACKCAAGWGGKACAKKVFKCATSTDKPCSGHGKCDETEGTCYCRALWVGSDCSTNTCKHDCFNGGECIPGNGVSKKGKKNSATVCKCLEGFEGEFCETRLVPCPNGCSGHGKCDKYTGTCACANPWITKDCSMLKCVRNCHNHGTCNNGTCACDESYTHDFCETKTCPRACSGHGVCEDDLSPAAHCVCDKNWGKADCSEDNSCPSHPMTGKMCSDRGVCSGNACLCRNGWTGPACEDKLCNPPDCSGKGLCVKGSCRCKIGFAGDGCESRVCPMNCTGHGKCTAANKCACGTGWCGEDCATPEPVNYPCGGPTTKGGVCGGHGMCIVKASDTADAAGGFHGACRCDNGWGGDAGVCTKKVAKYLLACETKPGVVCYGHGTCKAGPKDEKTGRATGKCECFPTWVGSTCKHYHPTPTPKPTPEPYVPEILCPGTSAKGRTCSGHGSCDFGPNATADAKGAFIGECKCLPGWTGPACRVFKATPTPKPTPKPTPTPTPVPAPRVECPRAASSKRFDAKTMMCGGHGVCFAGDNATVVDNALLGTCRCDTIEEGTRGETPGTFVGPACDTFKKQAAPAAATHVGGPLGCEIFPVVGVCHGHGACQLKTNAKGENIGSCDCAPGWVGAECKNFHPTPKPAAKKIEPAHVKCPGTTPLHGACSGHGKCAVPEGALPDRKGVFHGKCVCDSLWHSSICDAHHDRLETCPSALNNKTNTMQKCGGHGKCVVPPAATANADGLLPNACQCDPFFFGKSCTRKDPPSLRCPNKLGVFEAMTNASASQQCSGKGFCVFAAGAVPNDAHVVEGQCQCNPSYAGKGCQTFVHKDANLTCPGGGMKCGGHGICAPAEGAGQSANGQLQGTCDCVPGWRGPSCAVWKGLDYKVKCAHGLDVTEQHRNGCNGHGTCEVETVAVTNTDGLVAGTCHCHSGFNGTACQIAPLCKIFADGVCHGHGKCSVTIDTHGYKQGQCACTPGWVGSTCKYSHPTPTPAPSRVVCGGRPECTGHGVCAVLPEARADPTTNVLQGQCKCDSDWFGAICNASKPFELVCSKGLENNKTCSGHGQCAARHGSHPDPTTNVLDGDCVCEDRFAGSTCERFVPIRVVCDKGKGGKPCSGRGSCYTPPGAMADGAGVLNGKCQCDAFFAGKTCETFVAEGLQCPKAKGKNGAVCGGAGQCTAKGGANPTEGRCVCDDAHGGAACEEDVSYKVECPRQCNGHGECTVGPVAKADPRRRAFRGTCKCSSASWQGSGCDSYVKPRTRCPKGFREMMKGVTMMVECTGNGKCVAPAGATVDEENFVDGMCKCDTHHLGEACEKFLPNVRAICPSGGAEAAIKVSFLEEAEEAGGKPAAKKIAKKIAGAGQPCNGHGACIMKKGANVDETTNTVPGFCKCDELYAGNGCGKFTPAPAPAPKPRIVCPRPQGGGSMCNGHGGCMVAADAKADAKTNVFKGTCECAKGWADAACARKTVVPHDFVGAKCPVSPVNNEECAGKGVCVIKTGAKTDTKTGVVKGECKCDEPFGGPSCSQQLGPIPTPKPGPHVECPMSKRIIMGHFSSGKPIYSSSKLCSGHGKCAALEGAVANATSNGIPGGCMCDKGFAGLACGERVDMSFKVVCPVSKKTGNRCSGHGDCIVTTAKVNKFNKVNGTCQCHEPFDGPACNLKRGSGAEDEALCGGTPMCSGHGRCAVDFKLPKRHGGGGKCECVAGYGGTTCEKKLFCPNNCSFHGKCTEEKCVCKPGFSGLECEESFCGSLNGTAVVDVCSNHGICEKKGLLAKKCNCTVGYAGESCGKKLRCPFNKCSGHGKCDLVAQQCLCTLGFAGSECATSFCGRNSDCGGHGKCDGKAQKCKCTLGYTGDKTFPCSKKELCPFSNCTGHGKCGDNAAACICGVGFEGTECEKDYCGHVKNAPCGGHGECDAKLKQCDCAPGFLNGNDTRKEACTLAFCGATGKCHGHGRCDLIKRGCVCKGGWGGANCELKPKNCPRGPAKLDDQLGRGLDEFYCAGHGQCIGVDLRKPLCVCDGGWSGANCARKECRPACANGTCNYETGRCTCNAGFTGLNCTLPLCPDNCNEELDQGKCLKIPGEVQRCECNRAENWGGPACATYQCPLGCSGHGLCDPASLGCKCAVGWEGAACDVNYCKMSCSGHGKCSQKRKRCECEVGYQGQFCSKKQFCPWNNCSMSGICDPAMQKCICRNGYFGDMCQHAKFCPRSKCSMHGECDIKMQKCICATGYKGRECEIKDHCPFDTCHGHGKCSMKSQKCECEVGHGGESCEKKLKCPFDQCSGNGNCDVVQQKCLCNTGFSGESCETNFCKHNCSAPEGGTCDVAAKRCACRVGFTGAGCEQQYCPISKVAKKNKKMCGFGKCSGALKRCECKVGHDGAGCEMPYCPEKGCGKHGKCSAVDKKCMCNVGWRLDDAEPPSCTIPYCPNNCGGHGECDATAKACVCELGFQGPGCGEPYCGIKNNKCSGHGKCDPETKSCKCELGFGESFCEFAYCGKAMGPGGKAKPFCSKRGTCDEKTRSCKCNVGFLSRLCDEAYCGEDGTCHGHGKCNKVSMKCECEAGFLGDSCQGKKNCPFNKCSGHGKCDAKSDKCQCEDGYFGASCEKKRNCPFNKCHGHGKCTKATDKCKCDLGFHGENCEEGYCGKGEKVCGGHGECSDTTFGCECAAGFRTPSLHGKFNESAPCTIDYCTGKNGQQCNGHGRCDKASLACACEVGFNGKHCAMPYCGEKAKCSGHGECSANAAKCACKSGWGGPDCKKPHCTSKKDGHVSICSGHGTCNDDKMLCACHLGFKGGLCSKAYCGTKGTCSGHGTCAEGKGCECALGFAGKDCTKPYCGVKAPLCGGHGACDSKNQSCACALGYSGPSCGKSYCGPKSNVCNKRGTCDAKAKSCRCNIGFSGPLCTDSYCGIKGDCGGRGTCNATKQACVCKLGFQGKLCDQAYCGKTVDDKFCSEQGRCRGTKETNEVNKNATKKDPDAELVNPGCKCELGFKGTHCEEDFCGKKVPTGICSGRGRCDLALEACNCTGTGFGGDVCQDVQNGEKELEAKLQIVREALEEQKPKNASDISLAKAAKKIEPKTCPGKCSGHGKCDTLTGKCDCAVGFKHNKFCTRCAQFPREMGSVVPYNACSGHGSCAEETGKCTCKAGWGNMQDPASKAACVTKCPGKDGQCTGHGKCDFKLGACECASGYAGKGCERHVACPNKCSGHGICGADNHCTCEKGFEGGDDCSANKPCPLKCSGHGVCNGNGTCTCEDKFAGSSDCRAKETAGLPPTGMAFCPNNCTGHGECGAKQKCKCQKGFTGTTDCRGTYPRAMPPKEKESMSNQIEDALEGKIPHPAPARLCPGNCSGHGDCQKDLTCSCDTGFEVTADCRDAVTRFGPPHGMMACHMNCGAHGTCDIGAKNTGICSCDEGHNATRDCRAPHERYDPPKMPQGFPPAPACPNRCSEHGVCELEGKCECDKGFKKGAADCSGTMCPDNCNGHGACIKGGCACEAGWDDTPECTKLKCPDDCSGHGTCGKGKCTCDEGFAGHNCNKRNAGPAPTIIEREERKEQQLFNEDAVAASVAARIKLPSYGPMPPTVVRVQVPPAQVVNVPEKKPEPPFTPKARASVGATKCLNDCSGHGACLPSGQCKCEEPWTGAADCSKGVGNVRECSVCCSVQCVKKCGLRLKEGTAAYSDCFSDCSTGTGGDGNNDVTQGHIEAKTKGFGSKDVSQADIDKYELSDDDVSFLEEADGEGKTQASAITRKQAVLGGMGGSDAVVTRAGKGSCMAVCASGQYPEVGAKCHANIMTKQFGREAETKEMKTLVDRLVLETNRVR